MSARIRHASIYMGTKKIGSHQSSSYGAASGDEAQITDGGYFGHADGATTSTLSIDTIEEVKKGDAAKIVKAMLNKQYLDFTIGVISGELHEVRMRCKSYSFDSDTPAGTLKGKFEFEGGEPKTSSAGI